MNREKKNVLLLATCQATFNTGILGSAVAAYAIWVGSFVLFCAGLAVNGTFNGFATFYRFAGESS